MVDLRLEGKSISPVRPRKKCRIGCRPGLRAFKPRGVPLRSLRTVELRLDELEALRLADLLGRHHEAAGSEMGISRATFGRLIESARAKVARALVNGEGILIVEE